uniref:Uncharacterized protein n=1 Tax=Candidatus Kentrum sp. TC TaxID=2126339 RepID=A0A450YAA1_9GAMM|nr:MAG: hypothetical protein BECKTC1821E_GA0114239_100293 [Candidatus Kentron sp. TC]VFK46503.1 MAG: hypothetical protein BECKTC1821D_GA0114238_10326 [Candidatus Kentron sp. TC]VFK53308.1 MAG: hypothetical protein BECKTC1821F_GA0114240_100292 [Candidatus Kentron sp. TC]
MRIAAIKISLNSVFQWILTIERITDERRGYLEEEHNEIEAERKRVNAELNSPGGQ